MTEVSDDNRWTDGDSKRDHRKSRPREKTFFSELPMDILTLLSRYLSIEDILRWSQTNYYLRDVLYWTDPRALWTKLYSTRIASSLPSFSSGSLLGSPFCSYPSSPPSSLSKQHQKSPSEKSASSNGTSLKISAKLCQNICHTLEYNIHTNKVRYLAQCGYDLLLEKHLRPVKSDYDLAFASAARGGHLSIMNTMTARGATNFSEVIIEAAAGGQLSLIEDFRKNRPYEFSGYVLELAMSKASQNGHRKVISLLRDIGCRDFDICLVGAAKGGHLDIVEEMITQGADFVNTAMDMASRNGHLPVVRRMLELGAVNVNSTLIRASEGGYPEIIDLMIANGASNYDSCLYAASRNGHLNIVTKMISLGADDFLGSLNDAAIGGSIDIMALILSKLVEKHRIESDDSMIQREPGFFIRSISELCKCRFREHPRFGFKFLHAFNLALIGSTLHGHLEIVRLMVQLGANKLEDALLVAVKFGPYQEAIAKLLIESGARNFNAMLKDAAVLGHLQFVKMAIQHGATNLEAALSSAAMSGELSVVQFLVTALDPKSAFEGHPSALNETNREPMMLPENISSEITNVISSETLPSEISSGISNEISSGISNDISGGISNDISGEISDISSTEDDISTSEINSICTNIKIELGFSQLVNEAKVFANKNGWTHIVEFLSSYIARNLQLN